MRLGIMQPYFFPYIGYFSLIKHTDKFILLDEVQYIRHGWINRNRVAKPGGGWTYINVPLEKHHQTDRIRDVRIDRQQAWRTEIINKLEVYRHATYYRYVMDLLREVLNQSYTSIVDLNNTTLRMTCDYLGIKTPIKVFSRMYLNIEQPNAPDEWALNICKAIPGVTEYWNPPGGTSFFDPAKYERNGLKLKFIQLSSVGMGLSIIDVMMRNSIDEINDMLVDYELFEIGEDND